MIESGSLPSLRRLAMSKVRPSREGHPRASVPFAEIGSLPHRDRSGSAPRSVEFRTEIGPVPRRDRFSPASRSVQSCVALTVWTASGGCLAHRQSCTRTHTFHGRQGEWILLLLLGR